MHNEQQVLSLYNYVFHLHQITYYKKNTKKIYEYYVINYYVLDLKKKVCTLEFAPNEKKKENLRESLNTFWCCAESLQQSFSVSNLDVICSLEVFLALNVLWTLFCVFCSKLRTFYHFTTYNGPNHLQLKGIEYQYSCQRCLHQIPYSSRSSTLLKLLFDTIWQN